MAEEKDTQKNRCKDDGTKNSNIAVCTAPKRKRNGGIQFSHQHTAANASHISNQRNQDSFFLSNMIAIMITKIQNHHNGKADQIHRIIYIIAAFKHRKTLLSC